MLIKDFEKVFNISVLDLNEEKLAEIMRSEKFFEEFNSVPKCFNLFSELEQEDLNEEFLKDIRALKILFSFQYNTEILKKTFDKVNNNEMTIEELLEYIKKLSNNNSDPILILSIYLCFFIRFEEDIYNKNIKINEKDIETLLKDNIEKIKDILVKLNYDILSFEPRCEIIDLIYELREKFYELFNIDLLKDNKWVEEETINLNIFEERYATFNNENEEGGS